MKIRLSVLIVLGIAVYILLGLHKPSMFGTMLIENDMERKLDILVIDLSKLKTKHYEIKPAESERIVIPVNSQEELQMKRYLIVATDEGGRIYHNEYVSFYDDKTQLKNIEIKKY